MPHQTNFPTKISIFLFFSLWIVGHVYTEVTPKFLAIPFKSDTNLLQGWYYDHGKVHNGVDYSCELGDPIYAAADGIAMSCSRKPNSTYAFGKFVFIKHDNGYATLYAHLNETSEKIKFYIEDERTNTRYDEWTVIKKGDYIGECGMTGTTNSHLHFEVTKGKYAVDKLDAYDLYKKAIFYPGNSKYSKLGDNYLWESDPPEILKIDDPVPESIDQIVLEEKSWWQKTKDFFGNLFGREDTKQDVEGEKIGEEKDQLVYGAKIINGNQRVHAIPVEEIEIKIDVENNGSVGWYQEGVSLNIAEPVEHNKQFKHNSWLTGLRPTLLDQSYVGNDEKGTFSFFITIPDDVGEYAFQALVVKTGSWDQIGGEIITVDIVVDGSMPDDIILDEEENEVENSKDDEGFVDKIKEGIEEVKEATHKIVDNVVDTVVDVVKVVPTYFGGEGGSNAAPVVEEPNIEEMVADIISPTEPILNIVVSTSTTSSLYMSWQSTDDESEIIYYDVEYKIGEGEWSHILDHVTTTRYVHDVIDQGSHAVRVRAFDEVGNVSEWGVSEINILTDLSRDVVINEVAWMGISGDEGCDYDEWVELYNPGDVDISLDGWSFEISYEDYGYTVALDGIIEAGDYYVIGKYEDVILDRLSESVFVEGADLEDHGAKLTLWDDESNKIDETDQRSGWFAGSVEEKYRTMERIGAEMPGNNLASWKTNESIRHDVESYCGQVYGSPGQDNDHYWYLSNMVDNYVFNASSTFVLSREHSPYVFGRDTYVPENYIVDIEPGVTLLGLDENSSFIIDGVLRGHGEEGDHIIFTSIDEETGENYWQNIIIKNSGVFESSFVDFFYGGNTHRYDSCETCSASQVVRNEGGRVNLSSSSFAHMFMDNEIKKNDTYMWSSGGEVILLNNNFTHGYRGLVVESDTQVNASGLMFSHFVSSSYPVELGDLLPDTWKDNVFVSNTYNMTRVSMTELDEDYIIERGSHFLFTNLDITVSTTLTVNSGAQVYLDSYGMLNVYGNLHVDGTSDSPVHITSPGSFGGIYFENATGNLSHVHVSRGGSFRNRSAFPMQSMSSAMVWSRNSNISFDSCSLKESRRPGDTIRIEGGETVLKDCVLGWENPYDKVYLTWEDNGIWTKYSTLHLNNVTFKHMNYAVQMYKDYEFSYENMDQSNFENMFYSLNAKRWFPSNLFSSL